MSFSWLSAFIFRPEVTHDSQPEASEEEPRADDEPSPYSDQYETIIRQGHERPTPEFGAPTLVWHVGIWPRRYVKNSQEDPCDPQDTFNLSYREARIEYDRRRTLWIGQINDLVKLLQERGCDAVTREFRPYVPHELEILRTAAAGGQTDPSDEPTKVLRHETIGFTMWWGDGPEDRKSVV